MKNALLFIWEIAKIVIIAMLVVMPIRYFIFQPFFVRGESMEPNFQDGDYLIIDELSYRLRDPQRGEIIVFKYPGNPSQRYIKRIVGLPGELVAIRNGGVAIYDIGGVPQIINELSYLPANLETSGNVELRLAENEYFVLGDNRSSSFDSRGWGSLPEGNIIGRVLLRAWPFAASAKIETPQY